MVSYACYDSPWGPLCIGCENDAVVSVRLCDEAIRTISPAPLADQAAFQLQEYFLGSRKAFDFPIRPEGTAFQTAVWNALRQIPYGQVRTYGQIAAAIGKPNAARAVGQAANRNPLWIVIPCHRVVGKNGCLTGYAGGLPMKQELLKLEQHHKNTPEA